MKKLLIIMAVLLVLSGCTSTNYNKEHSENIEKLSIKDVESKQIMDSHGKKLSLNDLITIGIERNLNMQVKRLQIEIAKLDKKIAFSNFLPKIQAAAGYSRLNNNGIYGQTVGSALPMGLNLETRLVDDNFYSVGIGAEIPIFVPSTWFLYNARKKGIDLTTALTEYEKKNLILQITVAYYNILALQYEFTYLDNEMRYAKELAKNAEVALKTEAILPWERDQAQEYVASINYSMSKNKNDMIKAKLNLLNLLNLHPNTAFELQETTLKKIDITLDNALYTALEKNDLLRISDISKSIQKDKIRIAITNFLPKIAVGGGYYNTDNQALVDNNILFGSINAVFSLFNGFANINLYKKEKLQEQIVDLTKEENVLKVIMETVNAYNSAKDASEQLKVAKLAYSVAEGKLKQKRVEYQVGNIDQEEYMKAIAEYHKAATAKKSTEYLEQISITTLELMMGELK